MGLTATIVESPLELQKTLVIPQAQLDICECSPTKGNAAGNTEDHLDLTGANTAPPNPDNGAIYTAAASTCPATSSSTSSTSKPTGTGSSSTESYVTSTLYTTRTYTVTSCAPTVTNCPNKPHVTTEVVPYTTTVCPASEAQYTTKTITVTSCPPEVIDCPGTPYVTTTVCPITDEHTYLPTTVVKAYGTGGTIGATPVTTSKTLQVTAAAGKVAHGFGAAAAAGVFAAAALL